MKTTIKILILNNILVFNVKNNNNNNNSLMFNIKNRNKNKNKNNNNIMMRQSMTLMTLNVIQSILNSLHPLINFVNTGIQIPHTFLDVLHSAPNLG